MSFLKLYQFAKAKADEAAADPAPRIGPDGQARAQVELSDIIAYVIELGLIQAIEIEAVTLDPAKALGYIKVIDRREALHDEQDKLAAIRVHKDQTRCWFRLVVCKELMHVFDGADEATFDPERWRQLLTEIENPPEPDDASPVYATEFTTEWRALLILCPWEHRNEWKAKVDAKQASEMDLAKHFRIPLDAVSALLGPYYEEKYQDMVVEPLQREAAEREAANRDPNDQPPQVSAKIRG